MSNITKTELLHVASSMLLSKGLNGFSLQELASALSIKKSSLFHYYPSKAVLGVELIRFYQKSFSEWILRFENLSPEKQILNYGKKLTSWICKKQRVCPVGALGLEWNLVAPEIQIEVIKLHKLQKIWLKKLFNRMPLRVSPSEAVIGTMALIQGSIQLARMNEDPSLVTKNLKSYLKSITL